MDNQSGSNGQISQFDPTATPPPPGGGRMSGHTQAPGMVVEPSSMQPVQDSLAQFEQGVTQSSGLDLPPPPFEDASPNGPLIQPTLPQDNPVPVAPGDMLPPQEYSLPTAQPAAQAFDESQFVTDPSAVAQPVQQPEPQPVEQPVEPQPAPQINEEDSIDAMVQEQLAKATVVQSPAPVVDAQLSVDDVAAALNEPSLAPQEELPVVQEEAHPAQHHKKHKKNKKHADAPAHDTEETTDDSSDTHNDDRKAPEIVDPIAARSGDSLLEQIKQQALRELAPIASQLDQDPIDRFHTLLELIQATDSHDLVQGAFESAQAIEDDRERAAALLNLVNEVSYLEKIQEMDGEPHEREHGNDHDDNDHDDRNTSHLDD